MGDNAEKAWRLAQHCERKINALEKTVAEQKKTITGLSKFLDQVGRELMAYQNKNDARIGTLEKSSEQGLKTLGNHIEIVRKAVAELHS